MVAGIFRSKPWWITGFLGFFLGIVALVGLEILWAFLKPEDVASLFNHHDNWFEQLSVFLIIPALNASVGLFLSLVISKEKPLHRIPDPARESMRQIIGGALIASVMLSTLLFLYINNYLSNAVFFSTTSMSILFFSSFIIGLVSAVVFRCSVSNALKAGLIASLVVHSIPSLSDTLSRSQLETGGDFGIGLRLIFILLLVIITFPGLSGGAIVGGFITGITKRN